MSFIVKKNNISYFSFHFRSITTATIAATRVATRGRSSDTYSPATRWSLKSATSSQDEEKALLVGIYIKFPEKGKISCDFNGLTEASI